MKKLILLSLVFLLFFITGCTAQNENVEKAPEIGQSVKPNTNIKTDENSETTENVKQEGTQNPSENATKQKPTNNVNGDKAEPKFKRVKVQLVKPIDGDTIEVQYNGKPESVRFLLVDTPETHHPRLGKQPFGDEAKAFTTKMVKNANKIELEFDIGPKRDKYSRLLAYVYVDGKMLEEELLKRGLARVAYVYPPSTRYVDEFREIQKDSQNQGIGIWSVENYAQEDGYHPEKVEEEMPQKSITKNSKCKIKGNINSKGVKIYHVQGGQFYEITKPEKCFDTEKEAVTAGFRKSKR